MSGLEIVWAGGEDPPITVTFRSLGNVTTEKFGGSVFARGEDRKKLVHVPREKLAIIEGNLDLRRMPVVRFGGQAIRSWNRGVEFLEKNPDFRGAILIAPGTGQWDLDSGKLILTDEGLLDPSARVKGRPMPKILKTAVGYVRNWDHRGRFFYDVWSRGGDVERFHKLPRFPGSGKVPEVAEYKCDNCGKTGLREFYSPYKWLVLPEPFTGEIKELGSGLYKKNICVRCELLKKAEVERDE